MAEEKRCGAHSFRIEEPDTLLLRVSGTVDEGDAVFLMREQHAFSEGKRYLLLLLDLTHFRAMTAGARRVFARDGKKGQPRGVVIFGASFRARVLADLIFRAVSLLEGGRNRIRFLKDEAEARACLDELRRHFTGHGAG